MAVLSFVSMYVLMYAMVNSLGNVFNNLNQVYMAALMAAPMVIIELIVMRAMYHDQKRNAAVIAASLVVGVAAFLLIRFQIDISDRQFLRSMIPHHGAAILMCKQAPISDPDIKRLCERIIASQQSEIDEMRTKLRALEE
jgi:peptidoglycan/LPS O-acetylase OafA/YrhL